VLYTITFKSGAQQVLDLEKQSVALLYEGFKAVHESGQGGMFHRNTDGFVAGILLREVAAFAPHVSMSRRYSE